LEGRFEKVKAEGQRGGKDAPVCLNGYDGQREK